MSRPVTQTRRGRPAQQVRSRETSRRILDAMAGLLEEKPLEALSIAELAARAGVSVGGFYARFGSKEAVLLQLCDEGFFAGFEAQADALLEPARWEGQGVQEIVRAFVQLAVGTFRAHEAVLREVALWSRISPDAAFRARVVRFNQHVHERLSRLLLARRRELAHRDPRLAVDLAIVSTSATMRELILFGRGRPDVAPVSDRRLAQELTRMFCATLGVAQVPPSGKGK